MQTYKLLVVEDESIIAEDLRIRLVGLGYQVVDVVSTGELAVQRAHQLKPDLILMDIMLKGDMDGIEAARIIKCTESIPIIFVTAYTDAETLKKAKVSEPYGYILKPFEERQLNISIQIALYKNQTERKIKESDRWLTTTLKSIGDAVISTDINQNIVFMNSVAENLTGWKLNDALEKPIDDVCKIISVIKGGEFVLPLTQVLEEQSVLPIKKNNLLITKNGERIHIEENASPIKNEKDIKEGYVIVLRDVSEKKKAEVELIKLSRAIEQSPVSIIITNQQGIIEYVNNKFLEKSEMESSKIIGSIFYIFKKNEMSEDNRNELMRSIVEGKTWRQEFVRIKKNEGMTWDSISVSSVLNVSGTATNLIIVQEDISERKQAESAIKKYNDELMELNKSKDKFFSIVSHDLRSPFHGLLGLSSYLVSDYENLNKSEIKKLIDNLHVSTVNIFKYVENLLEWSRLQIGNIAHQPAQLDLQKSILYVFNLLSPNLLQKNISIEYHIEEKSNVFADQNMVNSILENLISNAIKFTISGGKIKISTEKQGSVIKTSITDNGIGIQQEILRKLFTLDSQYSTTGTSGEKGAGLGLLICKEMIEKNGGMLSVESIVGSGTTFHFTLPHYDSVLKESSLN
ncbi:MAG: PAS domain S-box protein [Ignavibacteriales bacterium]|nr:PAS domain S-box protein [Ignavibacteriales bacterium]